MSLYDQFIDSGGEDVGALTLVQSRAHSFLPGSIVRVALNNFVTYDSVEFFPGPYLNMIIGPNGTGKSTIVCAIALGLGWKPGVLGRAKDVASYVKKNCDEGWVEIELKAPKNTRQNVVIRRHIGRDNNSSDWRINGKKAVAKDVAAAVGQFDISLDNLCCFLPQDKVADFARMDPQRLLVETQRAAGHANLTRWHQALIEADKEHREIKKVLDKEQEDQNHLEQRNEGLSREVARYEQRERLREEVELLRLQISYNQYRRANAKYSELKKVLTNKSKEYNELRKLAEPIETKLEDLKAMKAKIEDSRTKATKRVNLVGREISKFFEEIEKYDSDTVDLQNSLDAIKQGESEHKKLVAMLKGQVADLVKQVEDEPEEADTGDIEAKIRKCRTAIREAETRIRDLQDERNEIGRETNHLHRRKDDALTKLKRMDDARARRLDALRTADNDCYRAVLWLRENRDLFEKDVFEPVMLEINVKSPQYVAQVESCLNWQSLRTFVCQTRSDYDRFTSELIDKRKLNLNVAENERGRTLAQMEDSRPLTLQQIQDLGFDDYIANLIEAPDVVLQYLCGASNIHLIPVALSDSKVHPEQVEQLKQIKRYIAGRSNHTISFSQYGRGLPQTLSRDIKPARALAQSVNQTEKDALDRTMQEVAEKLAEAEDRVGELNKVIKEEKEKISGQQDKRKELEGERLDAQQARRAWERAKIDLGVKRKRLDGELARPSPEQRRAKINAEISVLTDKRGKAALKMTEQLKTQWEHRKKLDIITLTELQHGVNLNAWRAYKTAKEAVHQDAERALLEAKREFQAAKTEAASLKRAVENKLNNAPPAIEERFSAAEAERTANGEELRPIEELEADLSERQGALDMAGGVTSRALETFKQHQAQIQSLGESITARRRQLQRLEAKISETRDQWLPALKSLVSSVSAKFSAAFERVGCAGEVAIAQDSSGAKYEEWGIEIRVKFRQKESLQALTGQRQSGGERSLSTILYLMSLTELSRSPFSLVDEINQGMDQRAERAVHDQMVEVTCHDMASQYFLITPKLLPDLRYHEKMKVLIINNGEWLPEKLDLNKYAAAAKRKMGQGGGADAGGAAVAVAA